MTDTVFTILIADRNRHVREFLRRELNAAGYGVAVAKDTREIVQSIQGVNPPDLLILDLELPFSDGLRILEMLQRRVPPLPVVIHTFLSDLSGEMAEQYGEAPLVEKSGQVESLRAAVDAELLRCYPDRFVKRQTGRATAELEGQAP